MLLDKLKRYDVPSIASHKDISYYPFLISPCITGVRVYVEDGSIYDINKEPIKNKYLQEYIKKHMALTQGVLEAIVHIEGESNLNDIRKMVDSEDYEKESKFLLQVHDYWNNIPMTYNKRLELLLKYIPQVNNDRIAFIPQRMIYSEPQLKQYEKACVASGYTAGVIIRKFDGHFLPLSDQDNDQVIVHKPLTLIS